MLAQGRPALANSSNAAAEGWLREAVELDRKTQALEGQVLGWEKRLTELVKRQESEVPHSK